jgi:hypothetical protein
MNGLSAAPRVPGAVSRSMLEPTSAAPFVHDTWWSDPPTNARENSGEGSGGRPSRRTRGVAHDKWWVDAPEQNSAHDAPSATGALLCFPLC